MAKLSEKQWNDPLFNDGGNSDDEGDEGGGSNDDDNDWSRRSKQSKQSKQSLQKAPVQQQTVMSKRPEFGSEWQVLTKETLYDHDQQVGKETWTDDHICEWSNHIKQLCEMDDYISKSSKHLQKKSPEPLQKKRKLLRCSLNLPLIAPVWTSSYLFILDVVFA